ncbi:hypothetical protein RHGRI_017029 [Rhododendron griersonianum]|uniref:Uncharacterized protein n=1 Tax=Rhododendron griersonianum TaxID=479676 RepID=A0AAV6JWF6_9ERIC|nr:hypothetical protein RHGRI_017029 [Rhododendron griersonianum]
MIGHLREKNIVGVVIREERDLDMAQAKSKGKEKLISLQVREKKMHFQCIDFSFERFVLWKCSMFSPIQFPDDCEGMIENYLCELNAEVPGWGHQQGNKTAGRIQKCHASRCQTVRRWSGLVQGPTKYSVTSLPCHVHNPFHDYTSKPRARTIPRPHFQDMSIPLSLSPSFGTTTVLATGLVPCGVGYHDLPHLFATSALRGQSADLLKP